MINTVGRKVVETWTDGRSFLLGAVYIKILEDGFTMFDLIKLEASKVLRDITDL